MNMKNDKSVKAPADAAAEKTSADSSEKSKPMDLGLTERRRTIRPLPVPDVVESESDTAWGAFQSLISDKPGK